MPVVSAGCCGGGSAAPVQIVQPELPPVVERAKNFLHFLGDFIQQPGFVSKEEAESRAATCETCERRNGDFCSVCGCWIHAAVKMKAKHCPLGIWENWRDSWLPQVHDRWLANTLVVIPCYGKVEMTQACVRDCLREGVQAIVVDAGRDYEPVGREKIRIASSNYGWANACWEGLSYEAEMGQLDRIVLLNNDTRLSPNFFAGLIVAEMVTGAKIVHASMNVGHETHRTHDRYRGPAAQYKPVPVHKHAGYVDGTAVSIHHDVLKECGFLDTTVSPKYGWNLLIDLCIRAKQKGHKVAITEAAYVEHLNMQTAIEVFGSIEDYVGPAMNEAHEGMERKWGQNYMDLARATWLPRQITKRNLIYHITPFASNDVWLRNVRQLLKRIDQFNGKRLVAIATGDRMVDPETVKASFGDERVEFILVENSRILRERASADQLFSAVESIDPNEATFYAHAKGVATVGDTKGVTYWRNAMYHELLDDPEKIEETLVTHPMVGTHRKHDHGFPDGTQGGGWHFAGTYWWLRHDAFFGKPWRKILPNTGWGMEALPGLMFEYDEVACIFGDEMANPYNPASYVEPINDPEGEPPMTAALKIELGGGPSPKEGHINIDKDPAHAEIVVDFDAPEMRLPFDDNSVADVYSSHCLEHVRELRRLVKEIARVCQIGARIEIRVPHWGSSMAMCHDHKQAIAEAQADHWCNSAVEYWLGGTGKRLSLYETQYVPSHCFAEAKQLQPTWTDEQIYRYMPDTCHEVAYIMHVQGVQ